MKNRIWSLLLSGLAVLAGCADGGAGDACESNPEVAGRALALGSNGTSFQGKYLNGIRMQGIRLQGISMQGVRLQGVILNSAALAGARSELVGTTTDGTQVSGADLVGATITAVLSDGNTVELTVSAFERNPDDDLAYYRIEHAGQNICGDDDQGLFVAGVWDEQGARHESLAVGEHRVSTSFSCTSGVLAKCMRWGYVPAVVGAELHQACTRMARADYCGNGVSYTRDGTLIDLYDVNGVQLPTARADLLFEAGWGEGGAVCVSRPRFDATTPAGDPVLPSCWRSLPRCDSFAEATARGALLANSSALQARSLCD